MGQLNKELGKRRSAKTQPENPLWMIGALLLAPIACALLAHGAGVCQTTWEDTIVEGGAAWRRLLTNCRTAGLFSDFQVIAESPYGKHITAIGGMFDGPVAGVSINGGPPYLVAQWSGDGSDWTVWGLPTLPESFEEQPPTPLGPSA